MITVETKISGMYKYKILGKDSKVKRSGQFKNLITDAGMDYLNQGTGFTIQYLSIGSGTRAPAFSDTQLQARITTSTQVSWGNSVKDNPPYGAVGAATYTLANTSGNGWNVSEIGIGPETNGSQLFSRALVLDAAEQPTTITVLDGETLIVTYEYTYWLPEDDQVSSFILGGNKGGEEIQARARPLGVKDPSFRTIAARKMVYGGEDNQARTAISAGALVPATENSIAYPYEHIYPNIGVAVSRGVTRHTFTFPISVGNFPTGVRTLARQLGQSYWQFEFNPPIMKTADDELTFTIDHVWGRL